MHLMACLISRDAHYFSLELLLVYLACVHAWIACYLAWCIACFSLDLSLDVSLGFLLGVSLDVLDVLLVSNSLDNFILELLDALHKYCLSSRWISRVMSHLISPLVSCLMSCLVSCLVHWCHDAFSLDLLLGLANKADSNRCGCNPPCWRPWLIGSAWLPPSGWFLQLDWSIRVGLHFVWA